MSEFEECWKPAYKNYFFPSMEVTGFRLSMFSKISSFEVKIKKELIKI